MFINHVIWSNVNLEKRMPVVTYKFALHIIYINSMEI